MPSEKQTLPTGYTLREGNSKDRLKLNNEIYLKTYCSLEGLSFAVKSIIASTLLIFFFVLLFYFIYYKDKILINQFFFNEFKTSFILILTLATASISLAYLLLYIFSLYGHNGRKFPFWVIEKDQSLVGLIESGKFKDNSCIRFLFVLPNHRRKGLGSALVKHLLQNTNKPVLITCSSELTEFYARLGFIQSGNPVRWGKKQIITMVYLYK